MLLWWLYEATHEKWDFRIHLKLKSEYDKQNISASNSTVVTTKLLLFQGQENSGDNWWHCLCPLRTLGSCSGDWSLELPSTARPPSPGGSNQRRWGRNRNKQTLWKKSRFYCTKDGFRLNFLYIKHHFTQDFYRCYSFSIGKNLNELLKTDLKPSYDEAGVFMPCWLGEYHDFLMPCIVINNHGISLSKDMQDKQAFSGKWVNPCCAEFIYCGDVCIFPPFLETERVHVVEVLHRGRQEPIYRA